MTYFWDKDGKMVTEAHNQKDRWKQNLNESLNPPLFSVNLGGLNNMLSQANFSYLSFTDGPPSRDKISYALKMFRNCKSQCVDGITNE